MMKWSVDMRYAIAFLLLCLGMTGCFPPVEEDLTQLNFNSSDPVVRQIFEARDRRLSDTLRLFLKDKHARFRYLSALSYASYRDSNAVDDLIPMLADPVEGVRQAAAFALGQIGQESAEHALISAFVAVDSTGPFNKTNGIILEALGKCGTDSTLNLLCSIRSYQPDDTLVLLGQMLSFYRFGLRDRFCPEASGYLLSLASDVRYPQAVRLMAAHVLQRFRTYDLSTKFEQLRRACNDEKDPEIRMCLVSALARIGGPFTLNAMEELYSRGLDQRIQANLLKGLQHHNSLQAQYFALKAIQNPSVNIAALAAQHLVEKGTEEVFDELKKLSSQKTMPWQVKSVVLEAALKCLPHYRVVTRGELLYQLKSLIAQAKSPYEKAAYIRALSKSTRELPGLLQYTKSKQPPAVETALAEGIESILYRAEFRDVFKGQHHPVYGELAAYFESVGSRASVGPLAVMASVFFRGNPIPTHYLDADSLLVFARQQLQLPRDVETYNELSKAIAKRSGQPFRSVLPEFNQPIDWSLLSGLGDTVRATISTSKGDVVVELYPAHAPGSVINFIRLIRDDFYRGKVFHRVVPNFVVQAGCPRGDGYGALDYSIRTEISMLDFRSAPVIGMASAGPDTEGTQFFITHSPTPHLDGKYTVLGSVIAGQDLLLSIEQGDTIDQVRLQ